MSVLIIGSEGSMGKRYQSILRFLGKSFMCVDLHNKNTDYEYMHRRASGFIVATPTGTHHSIIKSLAPNRKPILCEKPVTKSPAEFTDMKVALMENKTPFRMMMQYEMLVGKSRIGPTFYDYFRHGNDGLIWDCMQIIALARGKVELRENSPIWMCKINGQMLSLSHMDAAYIGYVQKWFNDPSQDLGYLTAIHQKVQDSEKKASNVVAN